MKGWSGYQQSPLNKKEDFKPHMMYKGNNSIMAYTYKKHLELKKKGYGHTKPKNK
tara:strand:- start:354 stop:518 length:165 start_codon:yes stop_codon:yes gene_type:complete